MKVSLVISESFLISTANNAAIQMIIKFGSLEIHTNCSSVSVAADGGSLVIYASSPAR